MGDFGYIGGIWCSYKIINLRVNISRSGDVENTQNPIFVS